LLKTINYILSKIRLLKLKKLYFFDIDDTVFSTAGKVRVVDSGGNILHSLSTDEFNRYVLKPGEEFDFFEFEDGDLFFKTAQPIQRTINIIKSLLNNELNKVIFLTARADMKNKDQFLKTFHKYGIPIFDRSLIYIERAGNLGIKANEAKSIIVSKYLDTGNYSHVTLFDDCSKNIASFLSLQEEYPKIVFKAVQILNKGDLVAVN